MNGHAAASSSSSKSQHHAHHQSNGSGSSMQGIVVPSSSTQPPPDDTIRNLASSNEQTWLLIGAIAEEMRDFSRAMAAYEAALRHNPNSISALTQVAGIARASEDYPRAAEFFQRVLNITQDNGEIWGALGHCYLTMDDLQKAYTAYQQALYHLPNPKEPKLWYGIGILYDRYGSLEHAEEAFSSVLKMESADFEKSNEIYFRLGIIYKQQHKYSASLDCFKYILNTPPRPLTEIDIWFQIGHVYEQQKEYVLAKEAYERVLAENPNHAKVLQQLGWLYHQPEASFANQKSSISYLTKSLEADATDAQSWYLLGRAYMAGQKYNKAYESYQQAVYRDGRNPTFWCSIGVLYYQINQYRDALDAYSRAIRLNPFISEVWYDLGSLYESCNNQITDAIDAYGRAQDLDPSNQLVKERLRLLKAVQRDGGAAPQAPPPQDVHPTAYASSSGPPQQFGAPPQSALNGGGPPPPSGSQAQHHPQLQHQVSPTAMMAPNGHHPPHPAHQQQPPYTHRASNGNGHATPSQLDLPAPPTSSVGAPQAGGPGPFRGGGPPPPLNVASDPQQRSGLAPMDINGSSSTGTAGSVPGGSRTAFGQPLASGPSSSSRDLPYGPPGSYPPPPPQSQHPYMPSSSTDRDRSEMDWESSRGAAGGPASGAPPPQASFYASQQHRGRGLSPVAHLNQQQHTPYDAHRRNSSPEDRRSSNGAAAAVTAGGPAPHPYYSQQQTPSSSTSVAAQGSPHPQHHDAHPYTSSSGGRPFSDSRFTDLVPSAVEESHQPKKRGRAAAGGVGKPTPEEKKAKKAAGGVAGKEKKGRGGKTAGASRKGSPSQSVEPSGRLPPAPTPSTSTAGVPSRYVDEDYDDDESDAGGAANALMGLAGGFFVPPPPPAAVSAPPLFPPHSAPSLLPPAATVPVKDESKIESAPPPPAVVEPPAPTPVEGVPQSSASPNTHNATPKIEEAVAIVVAATNGGDADMVSAASPVEPTVAVSAIEAESTPAPATPTPPAQIPSLKRSNSDRADADDEGGVVKKARVEGEDEEMAAAAVEAPSPATVEVTAVAEKPVTPTPVEEPTPAAEVPESAKEGSQPESEGVKASTPPLSPTEQQATSSALKVAETLSENGTEKENIEEGLAPAPAVQAEEDTPVSAPAPLEPLAEPIKPEGIEEKKGEDVKMEESETAVVNDDEKKETSE